METLFYIYLFLFMVSLALAYIVWQDAKRFEMSSARWAFLIIALGLVGLGMYLVVRDGQEPAESDGPEGFSKNPHSAGNQHYNAQNQNKKRNGFLSAAEGRKRKRTNKDIKTVTTENKDNTPDFKVDPNYNPWSRPWGEVVYYPEEPDNSSKPPSSEPKNATTNPKRRSMETVKNQEAQDGEKQKKTPEKEETHNKQPADSRNHYLYVSNSGKSIGLPYQSDIVYLLFREAKDVANSKKPFAYFSLPEEKHINGQRELEWTDTSMKLVSNSEKIAVVDEDNGKRLTASLSDFHEILDEENPKEKVYLNK